MPTGYTADLYDGKEVDFPTFVLSCARAFGATILLRDHDLDVFPTEENVTSASSYYETQLRNGREKLARFTSISEEELATETEQFNAEQIRSRNEAIAKNERIRQSYTDMLERVRAWQPPSKDHEELKTFMIKQLMGALDFDCRDPSKFTEWYPTRTPEEHQRREIESATWSIKNSTKEIEKERERNESRVKWVRELYESLELEKP